MNLQTPISELTRVGKTTAKRLSYLGVKNARDLLYYFPFRYEDYSRVVKISDLKEGEMVTVKGQIELIANKRSFRRRTNVTEALVSDQSGSLRVVWFGQPFIVNILKPGDEVLLSGKVKSDILGAQLVSPTYEKFDTRHSATHTARLVPIYPVTAGLTQKQIRFLVSQVIELSKVIPEWLPEKILEDENLIPLSAALHSLHFPVDQTDLKQSAGRLKFDELFLLQLKAELSRINKSRLVAPALEFKEMEIKAFVKKLPFALTNTQRISAWEILQDLSRPSPMNRLLSGDVGSGKTVVAAMAMYNAALNNHQAALMAPTEILARQHFDSLCRLLTGSGVSVGLFTRSQKMANTQEGQIILTKKSILEKIDSGHLDIIIGTHALLTEKVNFSAKGGSASGGKNLGLVIVDEQHRFGVEQRKVIKTKGEAVHFLSMTATPIPRSLALMLYGDLEVSVINELPAGRKKILTRLVEPAKRDKAYAFIHEQVKNGRQVFVVCPLIEEKKKENGEDEFVPINYPFSSSVEKKSVMTEYQKLSDNIFPDLRISYLHGKMPSADKSKVMSDFKAGVFDILVSTSVVEVGVDIPNASVMMIEGADRFGLAQLHQFRGRVGRSVHQSYCFLFTDSFSSRVKERLSFFEKASDGFKLAEKDLELRGPGEVYGTAQSGLANLRLAKMTDFEIIKKAREAAREIAPNLEKFSTIVKKVKEWETAVHLE